MSAAPDQLPASMQTARPAITWLNLTTATVMAVGLIGGIAAWVLDSNAWPVGLRVIVLGLGFLHWFYGAGAALELRCDLLGETATKVDDQDAH